MLATCRQRRLVAIARSDVVRDGGIDPLDIRLLQYLQESHDALSSSRIRFDSLFGRSSRQRGTNNRSDVGLGHPIDIPGDLDRRGKLEGRHAGYEKGEGV
jgi:hypothetical protein